MSTATTKEPPSVSTPVTQELRFCNIGPDGPGLFSVNPGIPLKGALEKAACFQDVAGDLLSAYAMNDDDEAGKEGFWAAIYLLEMSKAITHSAAAWKDAAEGGAA